jgi:hypothetical protein
MFGTTQANAANRQAQEGTQLLGQLRAPKSAWQKQVDVAQARKQQNPQYASARQLQRKPQQGQYASLQTLQQGPYASLQQLKRQKRPVSLISGDSGFVQGPQSSGNIVYTGTDLQQRKKQQQKKRKMEQARGLYAKPNKNKSIYQQTVLTKQQRDKLLKQANKGTQPTYMQMLSLRDPKSPLPPVPTGLSQRQKKMIQYANKTLSPQVLAKLYQQQQARQQGFQPIYAKLAQTVAATGYNKLFAKQVLNLYKLMKFEYAPFKRSLLTYIESIPMNDDVKKDLITEIDNTIDELKNRIKTANQQGKYSQQNKKGDKYFDTPKNLIEFINEAESREKKLLTNIIIAIIKSLKKQQKRLQQQSVA